MPRRSGRGCFTRLLILLVILTVGMILLAPYLPLNGFKPQIESALSKQLGRKVTVGAVHLSLSRGPALVIEDLKASEDPAFASGNTIEAGTVRAGIEVGPLVINRQIVVRNLELESPHLTFNRNSQGAWSWSTLGQASGQARLNYPVPTPGAGRVAPSRAILMQASPGLANIFISALLSSAEAGTLKALGLKHASVTFVEGGPDKSRQVTFDAIDLKAALSPRPEEPEPSTHAVGRLQTSSEKTETTELLVADLPFDIVAARAEVGGFTISGTVGPGD